MVGLRIPAFALLCGLAFLWVPAFSATIYVDAGGSGDYTTIQKAIDAANPSDQIVVYPGTYIEDLIVDQSISISALQGPDTVFLYPATANPALGSGQDPLVDTSTQMIRVQASDVTIKELNLDGCNPWFCGPPPQPHARNGIITDYTVGTVHSLTVEGCEISNIALYGICGAAPGTGHQFKNNYVHEVFAEYYAAALCLRDGADGTFFNNQVKNTYIAYNLWEGGFGIVKECTAANSYRGVLVFNTAAEECHILNNTLADCDMGIQVKSHKDTVFIMDNILMGCMKGISLYGTTDPGGYADVQRNIVNGWDILQAVGIYVTTGTNDPGTGDFHGRLLENQITHSGKGISIVEPKGGGAYTIDLTIGSSDDSEANLIYDNFSWAIWLDGCNDSIYAQHNYWETTDPLVIEAMIHHYPDDPILGTVDFSNPLDPSPLLFTSGTPSIGSTVVMTIDALIGESWYLMASSGTAYLKFQSFGYLLLDPSTLLIVGPGIIPHAGYVELPLIIPKDPIYQGLTFYFQALTGTDIPGHIGALSNLVNLTIQ